MSRENFHFLRFVRGIKLFFIFQNERAIQGLKDRFLTFEFSSPRYQWRVAHIPLILTHPMP